MLMLPDDLATCALMGILMNYHTNAQKPDPGTDPRWARTPAQRALLRLAWAAEALARDQVPGSDVSLFRALREVHLWMGSEDGEQYDPRRLVRCLLFNGLADTPTWTEAGVYAPRSESEAAGPWES